MYKNIQVNENVYSYLIQNRMSESTDKAKQCLRAFVVGNYDESLALIDQVNKRLKFHMYVYPYKSILFSTPPQCQDLRKIIATTVSNFNSQSGYSLMNQTFQETSHLPSTPNTYIYGKSWDQLEYTAWDSEVGMAMNQIKALTTRDPRIEGCVL